MILASDIEAKGLLDIVHSKSDVHCLCSVDIETGEVYLFHDHPEFDNVKVYDAYDEKEYTIPPRKGTLDEGITFWQEVIAKGGKLVIHNAHTYDRLVINRIWGEDEEDNVIPFDGYWDTFVQSKVQWYERPTPKGCKGPHGLFAYGVRSGVHKPEVTDWTFIDAFKLHRCIQDCHIQQFTYEYLEQERKKLFNKYKADFRPALRIESLYANDAALQELDGAKVDVDHIKACIVELDDLIEGLRAEIEPQLPPVIKGSTAKVSRKEMAEIFGYDTSKMSDEYYKKKKDGEIVDAVVKDYHRPTTSYTRTIKQNRYSAYHIEHGASPAFEKKKELTDWLKEHHNDIRKEWVVDKEVLETLVLNKNTCEYFEVEEDSTLIGGPFTRITITSATMTQTDVVKGFLIQLGWKHAEEWNLKTDVHGNKIKVEQETEVRWPEKAHKDAQLVKVIKRGGYMVSSPKLTEDDYEQLPEGIGKKIAQYNTYQHRRRFLSNPKDPENKGILSFVREDGRIPCGLNNFGTRSGRSAQRCWVNAPGEGSLYGDKIRACIIAEEGKEVVGVDMKSAQLSIAAYYANNSKYYDNVATGIEETEDGVYVGETAHCVNARMFGMVTKKQWQTAVKTQDKALIKKITKIRKKSKGGSFATLFGASGKKVAVTIGIPEKEGAKRKDQFLRELGLDNTNRVLEDYEREYPSGGGFLLPLAFGYWLWNNSSHKSLNTIVQGFEALAQKLCAIKFRMIKDEKGWKGRVKKILDIHDEILLECDKELSEEAGKVLGQCYTWAAQQIFEWHKKHPKHFANFGEPLFAIDLNGGFKKGVNYYEVH